MYIKNNQEKFLLQFQKNDALLAEYQTLIQDVGSPIHQMKAITEAIDICGAKMVSVTIQKAGEELTFKMDAGQLKGYRTTYNTTHISAAGRRAFEQMFGRHASFSAEDVTKITYGRNTIYETAEPVQNIGMGGMM